MTKKKRNTLADVDLKPLEVYTLFDSVLPTDTGIYAIVNVTNGKFYIGSTKADGKYASSKGFRCRFNHGTTSHRQMLLNNDHHCNYLQRSYNSTIRNNLDPNDIYQIWILEIVEPTLCLEVEQRYLDTYRPTYNGTLLAIGGDYERTPDIIEAMRLRTSSEYTGVSPSGEVFHFLGAKPFAEAYGLSESSIRRCANGKQEDHQNWVFFKGYLTEEDLTDVICNQKKKPVLKTPCYIAISPWGEILHTAQLRRFAKKHKIHAPTSTTRLLNCANKIWDNYKGWRIFYANDPFVKTEEFYELVEQIKNQWEPRGKYVGVSPTGEVIYFNNTMNFAAENNVSQQSISSCMIKNLKDIVSYYRGWTFFYSYDKNLITYLTDCNNNSDVA